MNILIIGANGNMGTRYKKILDYLGVRNAGIDIASTLKDRTEKIWQADRYIIATPTASHASWIKILAKYKKPILCEKPISTNISETESVLREVEQFGTPFSMVMQYRSFLDTESSGDSYYNYFKHGNDGIYYDCLQIIGLASGDVSIKEDSPIWECAINGKRINISDMDTAYISFIEKWLQNESDSLSEILEIHKKVERYKERVK